MLPAADAFRPQLVLVSAGFDAHAADPLANCCLQTGSFAAMARIVRDRARAWGVPVGVVLEGGYNREVLADCVCELLPALAGEGAAADARRRRRAGLARGEGDRAGGALLAAEAATGGCA